MDLQNIEYFVLAYNKSQGSHYIDQQTLQVFIM